MPLTAIVMGDPPELGWPGDPLGVWSPKNDSPVPLLPPVAVLLATVADGVHLPPPEAPVLWPEKA